MERQYFVYAIGYKAENDYVVKIGCCENLDETLKCMRENFAGDFKIYGITNYRAKAKTKKLVKSIREHF